jgi:oxygen-dependent protoporphyrinogen oxidase
MRHVLVIGGGIAGLSAAYYLKKNGVQVTLIERGSSVGGAIRTILKHERYLLEMGPNTFLSSSETIFNLSREIGIENKLVTNQSAAKKRYLFRKNCLHELPVGPKQFLRSPVMSIPGKMRVMIEPFIRSKSTAGESLAGFVRRRAGKELLEALVDPFVSGVWAGDAYQLEMKSVFPRLLEIEDEFGSIMKGMRALKGAFGNNNLVSYYWGMQTLPARIHDILGTSVRTDSAIEAIEPREDGTWMAHIDSHGETVEADAIVITTHANEAAELLVPHSREIFQPLMGIPYVSLAVVHTAYRRSEIPRDVGGFGFLIPRREKVRMLGSIWSSSLFPNRAPHGEVLLTNFIGGATDPYINDIDDNDLLTHIGVGLEKTMEICAEPRFYNVKRIPQAIPQYTMGHSSRLQKIEACLKKVPGIFLGGSYFGGISIVDTINHSKKVARSVLAYLHRTA